MRVAEKSSGEHGLSNVVGIATIVVGANFVLLLTALSGIESTNYSAGLIFLINAYEIVICLMIISIFKKKISISLFSFSIYFSIFMLIPGINHTLYNIFPFYGMSYSDDVILYSSLIIFIFCSFVGLGYIIGGRKFSLPNTQFSRPGPYKSAILLTFLLVASVISVVAMASILGIAGLFRTRGQENYTSDLNASQIGIFIQMPQAITFICFTYIFMCMKAMRYNVIFIVLFLFSGCLFFIANFPAAMPRYALFGYLLFWTILSVDIRKSRTRLWVIAGFLFGALVAMPLQSQLTRGGRTADQISIAEGFNQYLRSGDFDGVQSMNNAVIYKDLYGTENGRQILSALLFFVPRSVWPTKAEATGPLIARAAGYGFINVSSPLPSEILVDFGLPGVILGSTLLGMVLRWFDNRLEANWHVDPNIKLWAALMGGFAIIMYRGALLGVIPSVAVTALGVFLMHRYPPAVARPHPSETRAALGWR